MTHTATKQYMVQVQDIGIDRDSYDPYYVTVAAPDELTAINIATSDVDEFHILGLLGRAHVSAPIEIDPKIVDAGLTDAYAAYLTRYPCLAEVAHDAHKFAYAAGRLYSPSGVKVSQIYKLMCM